MPAVAAASTRHATDLTEVLAGGNRIVLSETGYYSEPPSPAWQDQLVGRVLDPGHTLLVLGTSLSDPALVRHPYRTYSAGDGRPRAYAILLRPSPVRALDAQQRAARIRYEELATERWDAVGVRVLFADYRFQVAQFCAELTLFRSDDFVKQRNYRSATRYGARLDDWFTKAFGRGNLISAETDGTESDLQVANEAFQTSQRRMTGLLREALNLVVLGYDSVYYTVPWVEHLPSRNHTHTYPTYAVYPAAMPDAASWNTPEDRWKTVGHDLSHEWLHQAVDRWFVASAGQATEGVHGGCGVPNTPTICPQALLDYAEANKAGLGSYLGAFEVGLLSGGLQEGGAPKGLTRDDILRQGTPTQPGPQSISIAPTHASLWRVGDQLEATATVVLSRFGRSEWELMYRDLHATLSIETAAGAVLAQVPVIIEGGASIAAATVPFAAAMAAGTRVCVSAAFLSPTHSCHEADRMGLAEPAPVPPPPLTIDGASQLRSSAKLRLRSMQRRGSTVRVRGQVAKGCRSRIRVRVTARGKTRSTKYFTAPRSGRWSVTIKGVRRGGKLKVRAFARQSDACRSASVRR